MVKCEICGVEKEFTIKDHLKWSHGLNKKSYLEIYPDGEVTSKLQRSRVSERSKKMWDSDVYKDKMSKIRKITHNKPEFKQKMSDIMIKIHNEKPELFEKFRNWHKTKEFKEWVKSESRVNKIRESSIKRWGNDEYRKKVIDAMSKSLSDGRCTKSDEFRENMSRIIAEKYANGELTNTCGKYKTGWYLAKDNLNYWFASSYEEKAMIILDNNDNVKKWTNKHGITIKYEINGVKRRYVPDFLVKLKCGKELIIETKGWESEEVNIKAEAAMVIYGENYKLVYKINKINNILNGV